MKRWKALRKFGDTLCLILLTLVLITHSAFAISHNCEFIKKINLNGTFSQVSGFLIGINQDQAILDVGENNGVRPGDLFTVFKKGKKIVDQKTGKTLGFELIPVAIVKIINVDQDFSTGIIISAEGEIPVPARVKKFSHLNVLLLGNDTACLGILKVKLKQFLSDCHFFLLTKYNSKDLPSYVFKNKISLIFWLKDSTLEVLDSDLNPIKIFSQNKQKVVPNCEFFKFLPVLKPQVVAKIPGDVIETKVVKNKDLMLFYLTPYSLVVRNLDKNEKVAEYKLDGTPLCFFISNSGKIIINLLKEDTPVAEILEYKKDNFIFLSKVKGYLSFAPKKEEVYLLKDGKVFNVNFKNGKIKLSFVENLPKGLLPCSVRVLDIDGDGVLEIIGINSKGNLVVYRKNMLLWRFPYKLWAWFNTSPIKYPPFTFDLYASKELGNYLFVSYINFPLSPVLSELETVPLDAAMSKVIVLTYKNGFSFKSIIPATSGFITGLSVLKDSLYFSVLRGNYRENTYTLIFKANF
ncbi:MAG: hypothetical protein GXO57_00950 [Thermodesulfobacteria bacterium]|nr:hypothetical protein [Thermodesulfobacteriota bacterium]